MNALSMYVTPSGIIDQRNAIRADAGSAASATLFSAVPAAEYLQKRQYGPNR